MSLDDAERQLLEYLADQPRGRGLVCEPHLCAAVRRLVFDERPLISDAYEMQGGWLVRITDAGREAIQQREQT